MKRSYLFGMAMAAGLSVQAHECAMTAYVQTDVRIDRTMVSPAELKAAALFREIGVEVRWRTGNAHATADDDGCGASIGIQLENAGVEVSPGTMAYATPFAESAILIHVFMNRVISNRDRGFATVVLAYVLAHEITHVLEGINRHSREGVMKAQWDRSDYYRMKTNSLHFAPADVVLTHIGLAKRSPNAAAE